MSGDEFSTWFRWQLKRREWSQADYARRTETATSVVSYWATGKRIPDPDSCFEIADTLGIDLDMVLIQAGHRPNIEALDPDDPRVDIIAMVRAVEWNEERVTIARALLNSFPKVKR